MEFKQVKMVVEAMLFAADSPLQEKHLNQHLAEELNGAAINEIIDALNEKYQNAGHSFEIVRVAGGFQMTTRAEFAPFIKRMYQGRVKNKLSQAALEVLSVVSFKQPVSKAEISAVRGANSDGVVKTLLERRLITISGRGEGIGRPLLYSTTPEFLEYFGINNVNELPKPREIEELFKEGKYQDQIVEALAAMDGEKTDEQETQQNEDDGEDDKPDAVE